MDDEQRKAHNERMRLWRANNRERAREISRTGSAKWSAANPERRAEISRRYIERKKMADPEAYREQARITDRRIYRERIAKDSDYLRRKEEQNKSWQKAHPERVREITREAQARWRARNPEKAREMDLAHRETRYVRSAERRQEKRKALVEFFGGACSSCGFSDFRALHIDHINGEGHLDRAMHKGRVEDQWRDMLSAPDSFRAKYQLLCANCNYVKRDDEERVRHTAIRERRQREKPVTSKDRP